MTTPQKKTMLPGEELPGDLLHADAANPVATLLDAAENIHPVHLPDIGIDGGPLGAPRKVLVVKDGYTVQGLKPLLDTYLTAPERRKGTAVFTDLASFIAHTKRFADEDSVIFAGDDKTNPCLTSVLDYHRKTAVGVPRFGEHRGRYAFPLSDEWKAWNAKAGQAMTQADFSRFMEDRLADVTDPASKDLEGGSVQQWGQRLGVKFASPSELLELSRGLAARVTAHVRGAHDVGSGATTISFATEVSDPNGLPLPVQGAFVIAIPVFRRGDLYPLPVRLRYRIKETVTWFFELARVDAVFEDAFGEALDSVAEETKLPVLRGVPE